MPFLLETVVNELLYQRGEAGLRRTAHAPVWAIDPPARTRKEVNHRASQPPARRRRQHFRRHVTSVFAASRRFHYLLFEIICQPFEWISPRLDAKAQ
jgi:hypothetical protein